LATVSKAIFSLVIAISLLIQALCLSDWTNRYIVPPDGSVIHVTQCRGREGGCRD